MTQEPLADVRARIDALDDRIIALLAERYALLRTVVTIKKDHDLPHRIESRVQEVLQRNEAKGVASGLPPGYVHGLYDYIIEQAHRFELASLGR